MATLLPAIRYQTTLSPAPTIHEVTTRLQVTLHFATCDIIAPVYEVVDCDGDDRRAYVRTHPDGGVFCVAYADVVVVQ